jgi:hypothetical protein
MFIDIDVEEIDKQVLNSERESIKSSIISLPITIKRPLINSLLAVSSIDNVMQYYDLFQRRKKPENTICVLLLFSPMAVMKIQTKQMIAFQMMNKNTIGRQNQEPL